MKKLLLLAVVGCIMTVAQAQRVYFIYMQSDNGSPFYLKTSDKVYSSSAHGYLIVPKLADSTYNVVIGKPGVPESRFTLSINGKDHGFLLRQNGQQLSLFNLQTLALIEPSIQSTGGVSYIQKTDRFTTLLAQAADDTTLLKIAVFAKAEKEPAPTKAVTKAAAPPAEDVVKSEPVKDTVVAVVTKEPETTDTMAAVATTQKAAEKQEAVKQEEAKTETAATSIKEEAVKETAKADPPPVENTVAEESVYKRSVVKRRSESSTSEGFGLMFTDNIDGVIDTIRIVIPNPKTIFRTNEELAKESKENADTRFLELEKTTAAPKTEVKEEKKGDNEEGQKRGGLFGFRKQADKEANITAKDMELKKAETPAANQVDQPGKVIETCKNNASSSDFARLRRNMVGKSTEDDMVAEAQKAFKNNCFTTQQLKTLSSLLLTSNGRYKLFAAGYNHVSDKENFKTLQNELWDREDINRFKALLAQ